MAIATSSGSSGSLGSSSSSSSSFAFTVSAGSNLILFVGIGHSSFTEQVTAIDYNGASMTKISYSSHSSTGASLWYLVNPVTGSNNVNITAGGGMTYQVVAFAYSGAAQTGVPDNSAVDNTSNGGLGTTAAYSLSFATSADNCWMIAAAYVASGGWNSSTGNSTTRGLSGTLQLYDRGPITPAGSSNLDTTTNNSLSAAIIAIAASFAPAAASAVSPSLMLRGCGA